MNPRADGSAADGEAAGMEGGKALHQTPVAERIGGSRGSAFRKYVDFFVGRGGAAAFAKYEVACMLLVPMPGAVGILLRRLLYPLLLREMGPGAAFGRNVALRHPSKLTIGARTAVDDDCLLDSSGSSEGITIGGDVLVARSTIIQAKHGPVRIGDRVNIGSQCQISSVGGIHIGDDTLIAGHCYIGGGRHRYDERVTLIRDQELYSKGPVIIGEDVWIGAGAAVLDGVEIGKGCVVGAGAVVQEDLPPYTVAAPYNRLVRMPRGSGGPE